MRTLAHLSDLHFGRVDHALLEPLAASVKAAHPDVVVVSGDLTQRARTAQFVQAAAFLAGLPSPQVVVPGNHDVPLFDIAARLLHPLDKFRRLIEPTLLPTHVDEEIAVLGLNTARALVMKNGRIDAAQVAALRETLCALPDEVVKVVVAHHPFDVAPHLDENLLVGGARSAMAMFAECGVDLLLAGHLHASHSGGTGARHALAGYEALMVSAGTATSTRVRGESNSFNVLHVTKHRIEVEQHRWQPRLGQFEVAGRAAFERQDNAWRARSEAGRPAERGQVA